MSSASIVRPAISDDRSELWRLFKLHHAENGLFPLSEPKVDYFLDRALTPEALPESDTGPRGIIGVIGPIKALEGVIMLVLGRPWYSEDITMDDAVNFVDPQHRQSNHARTLLAYAKHIVDSIRANHPDFKMIAGIVSTVRTAAKVRLYHREFPNSLVGAYFMYPASADHIPIKNSFRMR